MQTAIVVIGSLRVKVIVTRIIINSGHNLTGIKTPSRETNILLPNEKGSTLKGNNLISFETIFFFLK